MPEGLNFLFSPAFYARFFVGSLSPQKMDEALEAGYYRDGQWMLTSQARMMNGKWVSNVMLRLPIAGYTAKKRHRKLLTTNKLRFRHEFRPFQPDAAMEKLWSRFKNKVHGWDSVPTLEPHLLKGAQPSDFNLWQLCVFDEEKLVAFTVFDHARASICSLEAAYDPDYAAHSLGFYTMLLEIAFCQENGLKNYYPGFFPKDVPMFRYKLRPGDLQFFDLLLKTWRPVSELQPSNWLLEEVFQKLGEVRAGLTDDRFDNIPGFSQCVHSPNPQPIITESNVHLIVPIPDSTDKSYLFIQWHAPSKSYRVFEGNELTPVLNDLRKTAHYFNFVMHQHFHGQFSAAQEVLSQVQNLVTTNTQVRI